MLEIVRQSEPATNVLQRADFTDGCQKQPDTWIEIIYPGVWNNSQFTFGPTGACMKIVESANNLVTSTTQFVQGEAFDGAGNLTKQFFSGGQITGSTKYFYTKDSLSSIREISDINGNLLSQTIYDLWGMPTVVQGNPLSDFGYAAYYQHARSGLNLTPGRTYAGNFGRWLTRDAVESPNLYAYVGNCPVSRNDPSGEYADVKVDSGKQLVTISIPIEFIPQAGIDQNDIERVKEGIHQWWSGAIKPFCNVETNVRNFNGAGRGNVVVLNSLDYDPDEPRNWPENSRAVDDQGNQVPYVSGTNEYGVWNLRAFTHDNKIFGWSAAHEAGHLMGLPHGTGGIMDNINVKANGNNVQDVINANGKQ